MEDASGIALVLAQADDLGAVPPPLAPTGSCSSCRAGTWSGGAGLRAYIEAHRAELASMVLELHLEHAALEVGDDGRPSTSGARWWFTSRNPRPGVGRGGGPGGRAPAPLDDPGAQRPGPAPADRRRLPTTWRACPSSTSWPPHYLFDARDTLDKIDRDHLVPLSRAAAPHRRLRPWRLRRRYT